MMDFAYAAAVITFIQMLVEAGPAAAAGMMDSISDSSVSAFNVIKSIFSGHLMTSVLLIILLLGGLARIYNPTGREWKDGILKKVLIFFIVNTVFFTMVSPDVLLKGSRHIQTSFASALSGVEGGPMTILYKLGTASGGLSEALEAGEKAAKQKLALQGSAADRAAFKSGEQGAGEHLWSMISNKISVSWETKTDVEGLQVNASVMVMNVILTGVWVAFFVMFILSQMMTSILIAISPLVAFAFIFDFTRPAAKECVRQFVKFLLVPCFASLVVGFGIDNIDQASEVLRTFSFYEPEILSKNFSGYLLTAVMLLGGMMIVYSFTAAITGAQAGALGGAMAGAAIITMQQMADSYRTMGERGAGGARDGVKSVVDKSTATWADTSHPDFNKLKS